MKVSLHLTSQEMHILAYLHHFPIKSPCFYIDPPPPKKKKNNNLATKLNKPIKFKQTIQQTTPKRLKNMKIS